MVYDFSLASFFEITGVDTAMCYRAGLLKKAGYRVGMIFPSAPYPRDLRIYHAKGADYDQMIGVHAAFTDIRSFEPNKDLQGMLEKLRRMTGFTEMVKSEDDLILKKDGHQVGLIQCAAEENSFYAVQYWKDGLHIKTDFYTDVLYASCSYTIVTKENINYSRSTAKQFYNRDGSVAFFQFWRNDREYNSFPDGKCYSKDELFALFVEKLPLTPKDLIILDRPIGLFSAKPIFMQHDHTNILTVLHSEHLYEEGKSFQGTGLGREYWYWFKNSDNIDRMIVGTEEQKKLLKQSLEKFGAPVPEITAIPAVCLNRCYYPDKPRIRKAVVCVARLDLIKKIEWTIMTIVEAHKKDTEITLDIYGGTPNENYMRTLQNLIVEQNASEYIHMKGHQDVSEVYQNYELFLTTSLGESFGITLLEAAGSGLSFVGLDVRYGNTLFIENDRNGYRVSYDGKHAGMSCPPEVDELADRVVEILNDRTKLERFRNRSYTIAQRYLFENVNRKWLQLLEEMGVAKG